MGPKKFEKEFKKRMNGLFNETKLFFFHDGGKTNIAYIDKNKLKYISVYRDTYYLDLWSNHFIYYLQTGIFDTNTYWRVYSNTKDEYWLSEITLIPMKCEKQVWTVHSPEMDVFMRNIRSQPDKSGVGFKHHPRPSD